jgi:hypothetical protein
MPSAQFQPGFRCSCPDLVILLGGAAAAGAALVWLEPWAGFVISFVIGHFFLFCNVFRIARMLELAWAALFVVLAAGTVSVGFPGWPITVGLSLAATVVVVILEMRKPSYHGIFWQQINPGLREWWELNAASAERPA